MAVIALDLGGTKLASAIISPAGRIIRRGVALLEDRHGKEVGRLISDQICGLLAFARAKRLRITALTICVPGISYNTTGKVWAPNIRGWEEFPLRHVVQTALRKFGGSRSERNMPVHVAGDRACYILGEAWRGSAKGSSNAIFLAVGTGIGAGILVNGKVLHGAHDIAGAIGWMALDSQFRPEYRDCGCFEFHASGSTLDRFNAPSPSRSNASKVSRSHAPTVFSACDAGDRKAKEALSNAVRYWGMAVANLVSIFNPEVIIFGGGVFGPAKKFIPAIYKEAKRWAQPIAIKKVMLRPSKLGGDAALFGAAYLALGGAQVSEPARNKSVSGDR